MASLQLRNRLKKGSFERREQCRFSDLAPTPRAAWLARADGKIVEVRARPGACSMNCFSLQWNKIDATAIWLYAENAVLKGLSYRFIKKSIFTEK